MAPDFFTDFADERVDVGDTVLRVRHAGDGPTAPARQPPPGRPGTRPGPDVAPWQVAPPHRATRP